MDAATTLAVTFFAGRNPGEVVCRLPNGKIAFPSYDFSRRPPQPGETHVVTVEEYDRFARVSTADPSFLVVYTSSLDPNGRMRHYFEDRECCQYQIGYNWDWSHHYPRAGEVWRVAIQTIKGGTAFVLPHGQAENPFPKMVHASHPRADQLVGCWKYLGHGEWSQVLEIEGDQFVIRQADGAIHRLATLSTENLVRHQVEPSSMSFPALENYLSEHRVR